MTAPMCAIKFSSGQYGPLVSEDQALRAFEKIPEHRRALCRVTYWREVASEDMDTRPPPADFEAAVDPFRFEQPTIRKGDE